MTSSWRETLLSHIYCCRAHHDCSVVEKNIDKQNQRCRLDQGSSTSAIEEKKMNYLGVRRRILHENNPSGPCIWQNFPTHCYFLRHLENWWPWLLKSILLAFNSSICLMWGFSTVNGVCLVQFLGWYGFSDSAVLAQCSYQKRGVNNLYWQEN